MLVGAALAVRAQLSIKVIALIALRGLLAGLALRALATFRQIVTAAVIALWGPTAAAGLGLALAVLWAYTLYRLAKWLAKAPVLKLSQAHLLALLGCCHPTHPFGRSRGPRPLPRLVGARLVSQGLVRHSASAATLSLAVWLLGLFGGLGL